MKTYSTIQQSICLGCKGRDEIIEVLSKEVDKQNCEIAELNKQLGLVAEIAHEDFEEVAA